MLKRILHTAQTVLTEPIEAEGTKIELKTVKAPFKGLHVYGRSTQETTDGVNVYAGGSITRTWENAEDGSIDVNTGNAQILLQCGDVFQSGGFLLFDCDIDVPIRANLQLRGVGGFTNWGEETKFYIKSGKNKVVIPAYSFLDGQVKVGAQIRKDNTTESHGTPYTLTLSNIMVKAGQEEHEYEPYTGGIPSPNPDYPQEIKSVGSGGSIDVEITGKNLFDSSNLIQNGSAMNFFQIKVPNGIYTLSSNVPRDYNGNACYIFLVSGYRDDTSGITSDKNGVSDGINRTVETDDGYVTILYRYQNQLGNFSDYWYQLEAGDKVTKYHPYSSQTIQISTTNVLPGIPVSSGGNYTDSEGQQWVCDEIDFDRGVYVRNIVSKTFNGSASMALNGGIVNGFLRCRVTFKEIANEFGIDGICDKFVKGVGDMERFNLGYRCLYLWIDISRLNGENSTLDDVKIFMNNNPITVCARREIPVEELLTTEELTAYKALHSNYPTTIITNSEDAYMKVNCLKIFGGGYKLLSLLCSLQRRWCYA